MNDFSVGTDEPGNSSPILFTEFGPGTIVKDVQDVYDADGRSRRERKLKFE